MAFMRPLIPLGKSEEINAKLALFLAKVEETIVEFDACLTAFCKADIKKCRASAETIDRLETEADEIRRELEKLLYARGLVPAKEDLIELIEKVDDLADYAEIATWDMDIKAYRIPKNIAALLINSGHMLVEIAASLKRCVGGINIDVKRSLAEAEIIKQKRDVLRRDIHDFRHAVYKGKIDLKLLHLLTDVGFRIMRIADAAEQASDRVSAMIAKMV